MERPHRMAAFALFLIGSGFAAVGLHPVFFTSDDWWPTSLPLAGALYGAAVGTLIAKTVQEPHPAQWAGVALGGALGFAANWLLIGEVLGGAYGF